MQHRPQAAPAPSRRSVFAGATVLAAIPTLASAAERRFFRDHELPIGLQLYTLGEATRTDLDGTLKAVAAIGYRTVELPSLLGRTPLELRQALDRTGLTCASLHAGLGSAAGRLAEQAHALGCDRVVAPMFALPKKSGVRPLAGESGQAFISRAAAQLTLADWKWNAELLNRCGAELKREGLKVGYHNHNVEFSALEGGRSGLDVLLAETDPDLVAFEMDVGWVAAAGRDPVELLRRHPGRFELMHVKDLKRTTRPNFALEMDPAEVGAGVIDWRRVLPAAYAAGVRGYFVEQEPPFARDRLAAARLSFDYLDRLRA